MSYKQLYPNWDETQSKTIVTSLQVVFFVQTCE